ncbi:MAG TPA: hypothetical protein VM890_15300 [Longimicrobium sp.]|nr:hypothetical protein [Longimicrobium sp.]
MRDRLGGSIGAWDATAESANGESVRVCVKPFSPSAILPDHLFANWCGNILGETLGVPVARAYLVRLDRDLIPSLGSRGAGVEPGIAFATQFQEDAVLASELIRPDGHQIKNPEAVACGVVMDSLLQQNDREDDVLLVPVPFSPGKYELCFIDNGWTVWFPLPTHLNPVTVRWMKEPMASLVQPPEHFVVPLFMAQTLQEAELTMRFARCPLRFRRGSSATPRTVASAAVQRGVRLPDALRQEVLP